MTTPAPIAKVVQTCVAVPSQWDAWTADGTQLYFRYRFGRGRVEVGDGMRLHPEVLASWDDDDEYGGFMTLEDFMAKAELTLADGADVVPLEDDREEDPDHTGPESLRPAKTPAADPPAPVPFLQGTFALYVTPGGGAVLAYRAKGSSDDKQLMIPPFILQMAAQSSGLSPDEILNRIQSGNLDG